MASPRTIRGDVNGTGVVTYQLPPGLFQYVQSIRVEVDNSAGSEARPQLDISEQAGVVIATKRQGEAIPAGDTGSATWALRLDDETPTPTPPAYVFDRELSLAAGSAFDFDNIAQDARDLVFFGYVSADQILVELNGDVGLNYNTLAEHIHTDNGVLTPTVSDTGITNRIEFAALGNWHQFTLTIPYYRYVSAFSFRRRMVLADVGVYGITPIPVHEYFDQIRATGFWYGNGAGGPANNAPAITRVLVTSGSPLTGRVTLYRVM